MKLDFKKMLKVATIPLVVLIVWSLIQSVIGFAVMMVPFLGLIMCGVVPLGILLYVAMPAWAGFKAAKEAQMDLVGGAVTGGLVGLIASIIGGVLGIIVGMLSMGASLASSGMGMEYAGYAAAGAGVSLIAMVFSAVSNVVFWTIVSVVFGAAGAFVAKNMK